jgi:hypothetical protein
VLDGLAGGLLRRIVEAEELRLPGRGMSLPEVHLLRQGRSLSATPRLMVVSML